MFNIEEGVPLITQVVLLICSGAGRAGEIVQLVMADPLLFKVDGVTDIALPAFTEVPVEAA